ncbi:hypothetical protein GCM10011575_06160 [Microlunatus endophyticus]|uniref:Uncharacterized protein n=1 Tax=Microlunatus endophyticus TaxID=1716077 RepID=A0A917S2H3_9ACTN|nr:CDP-alcohol phosphatidyltransferase family protein [Microlunatus endophyticus]GGL50682.1 hypothetical protein GCM10011575_06160 [Microlunatus endophyticus]
MAGWHDQLAAAGESDWWNWATDRGAAAGQDGIDWILGQAQDRSTPADQPPAVPGDDQPAAGGSLRGLVLELINSGFGDEKALLATARSLRARIENPGAPVATNNDQPVGVGAVEVVRSTYLSVQDPDTRAVIFAALLPFLAAAAEAQAPRLLSQEPAVVTVRLAGRSVGVTATGPDPAALRAASGPAEQWSDPAESKPGLYAFTVVAIACAVIGIVLILIGVVVWLAVILLLAAVVTGILAIRALRAGRQQEEGRQLAAADRDRTISEAKERAGQIDQAQREATRKTADQLDRIRLLVSEQAPQGEPAVPAEQADQRIAGSIG